MIIVIILSCFFSLCGSDKLYSVNKSFHLAKTKTNFKNSVKAKILLDENNLQCNTSIPAIAANFSTITAHINDNVFSVIPLCLGNVSNISNLIDNNLTNFTNINITGIGCNATIGARNNSGIAFPGGTWAGFKISSTSLLDVSIAATVTVSTYNNGVFSESHIVTSSVLGIDSDLLNNDGTYNAGFFTTQPFTEIRITYSSLVGVLFSAQIFHPIVMNYCSASPPACNTTNKLILPHYPVTVDGVNTGINALACALCDVQNAKNVIDSITTNYATINLTIGVVASGSLSVKNVIDNFDVETFAGFDIEQSGLLDIGILDAITISTYNNGILMESKTGQGNLILTNTSLLTDDGRRLVGFLPDFAYDEIKLTLTNVVGIDLSDVKVYGAVYEFFCNGPLECNQTYPLIKPERPVFINSERTGVQGVVSVGCSVSESLNLLDIDTTNYATITMAVSALSTGSISVKSAYQVYPQGSKAGFAIRDMNTFIQADVFESITVCTYMDDVVSECKSGGDLLDVSLLSNIIGSGPGVYNIGFRTSLPYDEVTIEVGSLASALNIIRVYGAFVDTRGSFGDILDCCVTAPPTPGDTVCVGDVINLNQIADGLWSTTNNLIAIINNLGQAQTTSSGVVSLANIDTISGCVNNNILDVTVAPRPTVSILGNDTICVGSTTLIDNLVGGILSSTDNSLVNITGNNLITGLNGGSVNLYLLDNITGCVSDTATEIVIIDLPTIDLGGTDSLCEGSILDLGILNGNYSSSNPLIASVDVNGIVTANASGFVSFTFSDAFGCTSLPTSLLKILPRPTILLTGDDNICEGESTSLISTELGLWVSSDTTIATVDSLGIVNSIGTGSITISLINSNLCVSLPSEIITINPNPTVINLGRDSLCVGDGTILSASAAGTWISTDVNIATITNGGLVSAYASGQVSFQFTENNAGCKADTIISLTVNPNPVINVTGDAELCIGESLNLLASGGIGIWSLSDTNLASIDVNGVLTGLSPGDVSIDFTNLLTGCKALVSPEIMIFGKPTIDITGDLSICIGATTTLSPLLSGIWEATDSLVVSVDASGVVTGLSEGTSAFIFTESATGCVSDTSISITVMVSAEVSITGDTVLCIGEMSQLSANQNGSWASSDPLIASVNNLGVVTALNGGQVQFIFTSDSGCVSNPTSVINIHHKPVTTITGNINLCLGQTITVNPNVNGNWISTKPWIASITNGGLITALNPGSARFIYTDLTTGCSSDSNIQVIINAPPVVVLLGSSQLCIGQNSQVSPTTQGIWISSNPAVVSVTNSGFITAFTPGTSNLTFISNSTGCVSNIITITVNPKPVIQIVGDLAICVDATTNLLPSSGGSWYSNNPDIATIDNNGIVTGVSQGAAKFYFVSNTTGCQSNLSAAITINSKPYVNVIGPIEICAGTTTQLLPIIGGIWTSLDVNIATIDNNGMVTGIDAGITSFEFTDTSTNCASNLIDVEVNSNDPIYLSGNREICIGYNTSLFPLSGGIFVSSDASIASVDNTGIIRAKAEGKVSFGFIHSITGCISNLAGDSVEVFNCFDPDFNASLVNVTVNGNLSTNDEPKGSAFYTDNHFIVSKPSSSVSNLQVNSDGTYNFTANKQGEYIYQIPICLGSPMLGCPTSNLKITVLDPRAVTDKVVVNTDIVSVYSGNTVTINTISNDDCINIPDCNIDFTSVAIIGGPNHGAAIVNNLGQIQYVPQTNFYGLDTIIYRICSDQDNSICKSAIQIVNVKSTNASNSTVAYDDFYAAYGSTLMQGNVLTNDSDPEGDNIYILAQGDKNNQIQIPQGTYYILNDGEFEFMPKQGFKGSVDLIYTMCDDNAESACVKATVHVLVLGEMTIQVRAYLEGALINNGNSVASTGRPLMRDNLRVSNFTGQRHIPSYDPYKFYTEFTFPSLEYGHVSNNTEFDSIPESSRVFNETGENAIVDWVYMELRNKNDDTHIFATRSALLQRDGDVVDLDGISAVRFPGILLDSFYVVLRHRSHLGVMSQKVSVENLIDFTSPQTAVFNFGNKNGYNYTGLSLNGNVKEGYKALWAGDANGDGKIKFHGTNDDVNYYFADVLNYPTNINANSNFDFAYGYFSGDFNMDGKSKFDNPFDDKNYLFATILFYPLNENYLSNFDHFIEQIPAMRAEQRPN